MIWLIAVLPLVAFSMTISNLLFWPRGRRHRSMRTNNVSILIPARDEASRIEACVHAACRAGDALEIIVYDDASTDDTAALVEKIAEGDPRVRVVTGAPLPTGWVGKAHACHQLAKHAKGRTLLFIDADTRLEPHAIERVEDLFERYRSDVVTAVPLQETKTLAERLVLPMLHVTYTSWLFTPLVWATRDPRFLAANGQLLAVRREAYEEIGGFEAVHNDVVEDMAFCRLAKQRGQRVVFADGANLARCRMYEGWTEVWEGFSKNLYLGVGGKPFNVFVVVALYLATYVLPFVALPFLGLPALVGALANVLLRVALAVRYRMHVVSILLHPFGALAVVLIALNSWRWAATRSVRWRGRSYPMVSSR